MPDADLFSLSTKHFTIEGRSRAGHETYFRVRELGLALDIGRCPDSLISVPTILISHAHIDHAAGIPFYANQRRLYRMEGGRVVVPALAADDMRELMKLQSRLTDTEYDIQIAGLAAGETLPLDRNHVVRAHAASHRIAANAYEICTTGGKSLIFYTGDTDRQILETNEALFRAEALVIECSFVGGQDRHRAPRYRHMHFDDIAAFAERFENSWVILSHFSRRYRRGEIRDEIRRRCPAILRDRIRLALPAPFDML